MSSLFSKPERSVACLKACVIGDTGSGKTHLAALVAIGMHKLLVAKKVIKATVPVLFADTESGVDWHIDRFADEGVPLLAARTRAFSDLMPMIEEAEKLNTILVIDSLTHFGKEQMEAYKANYNKTELNEKDWGYLYGDRGWGGFTRAFVNSQCHIVAAGRLGFDYDKTSDDETVKTAIKMQGAKAIGYEPNIVVLCTKTNKRSANAVDGFLRTMTVLKDRGPMDGKVFENATFENFMPHIDKLKLGGKHVVFDDSRTSANEMPTRQASDYRSQVQEHAIVVDEIKSLLSRHFSATKDDKAKKSALLMSKIDQRAQSTEWLYARPLADMIQYRNQLWQALEKTPYSLEVAETEQAVKDARELF